MIPYARQDIDQADIDAVVEILRSDFLTQGPVVPRFEQAIADCCGTAHAIATSSATSALHLACLALGVGPGDRVWTSPITFVASANCARYCGARVDFVDIDPRTYNMNAERLAEKLVRAKATDTLPKVVIPVHFAGQSCDMAAIHELSRQYHFRLIEDAAHAIGGRYRDEPIGSCRYSDITVFSFHPVKIITTGEGGMALTNDPALARRMARLRGHGITRDPAEMTHDPDGPWYYQQLELGFNYRMTDIQAGLGISQMARLGAFVARRHEIARYYDEALEGLPVMTPWRHPDNHSALHLYVIRLRLGDIGETHREVFEGLRAAGIGVNLHYIPVYRQPDYAKMGFNKADFPEAERYYSEAITLPLYPGLNGLQQEKVIRVLRAVFLKK
uniref:UDP-4-amino-4,6-dideoxy-N-acetyl-beta-L-altrosamine transaminase n=1 Tax=Candidatus Kentrum sp. FM TaxID=2126340 RepID=A0A450SYI7_9GAMM|nr:MAG: UDP-4-amino-4,6-dideoxy-N-acetyl-beta-L-altrosamine transaminase [Candidatus Kentron sp. FM]VFJ65659.1 MAG: UDP-4-amino-4,6-dideoxy-N-acetyl-beta-L-altrosamine transaminase [Candidatus Kentron sp. FM]VFK17049.1 MAG: UDP-4-amino-4,6-dideoxy-N-acetyl-beta-L-altrosamine transaminase [Candidatus Kentron sp. FM]